MRILFVITRADVIGGAQAHVRDVSQALRRLGHDVEVITGPEGLLTEQLRRQGIPVHHVSRLSREINPIRDFAAVYGLWRLFRSKQPDLVWAHSSKAGWVSRVAARAAGVPCLFTAHGWAFTEGVSPSRAAVYALAERLVGPLATRIITVSDYDRRLALRRKVAPDERLVVIHNGVPDVPVWLRSEPERHPPRIVMVARFAEPKDHVLLLQSLRNLEALPWELELVGSGPLLSHVREVARQLRLDGRVTFSGDRDDVAQRLANAQLFVLTSRWEGLPLSVLEAMRAGLPTVVSDVGGCSEAVQHGVTGYLVPRGDLPSLQKSLHTLITRPELRKRFGLAGRKKYEDQFTLDRMMARIEGLLKSIHEGA
ncbi:glycosyltransferase family 4 protein [Symbiobacterium thermophilum]|uniref:Glycosyl transferase family 1 n=1 Tax=Symbiobacterium thermophilum TaxID=2734 RepID=A0A953LIZ8_SYMTR|nr:glycosyltransferase family 4 protein [Symbiobacterium thermophilum]MBY6276604.1 glycosyl transferase family 1 [Symbiobacterium thermophilum]